MKHKNIKWIICILVISLIISFIAGCSKSSTGDKQASDTAPTSDVKDDVKKDADPDTNAEPEIRWSGTISVSQYAMGPIENDEITHLVEEELLKKYGYDVDFEIIYLENNQYGELINLRIASNEAPDIFKLQNASDLELYVNQGVIKTWSVDFLRKHAPTVAQYIESGGPLGTNKAIADKVYAMCSVNGEMAVMPLIQFDRPFIDVMYNTKWLENLGVEKLPETLDEWVDLMYRFTREDPDRNGKDDTYGLSTTAMELVFSAYGAWTGTFAFDQNHFYDVDGELVAADVLPRNKEALALLAKMYADGVIDPEFVTGENQGGYWAISHAFVNGRIGCTYSAGINHYFPADMYGSGNQPGVVLQEFQSVQGPDATVTFGPYPVGPYGDSGPFRRYGVSTPGGNVYNANLPEDKFIAIFEILDIFARDLDLCTLAISGIEGVHWYYEEFDGHQVVKSNDEFFLKDPDNPIKGHSIGLSGLRGVYGAENPYNDAYMERSTYTPAQKYLTEHRYGSDIGYYNALYTALPSETEYREELNTYKTETWIKIITGELPVDYYDTYVENWYNMGGKIITEEANDWYRKEKEMYNN